MKTFQYNLTAPNGDIQKRLFIELEISEGARKEEIKKAIRAKIASRFPANAKFAVSKISEKIELDITKSIGNPNHHKHKAMIMGVDTLIKKLKGLPIEPKSPLKGRGFARVMLDEQALAPLLMAICHKHICTLSVQLQGGNNWRAKTFYYVSPELGKIIEKCNPDMIAGLSKSIENWAVLSAFFKA